MMKRIKTKKKFTQNKKRRRLSDGLRTAHTTEPNNKKLNVDKFMEHKIPFTAATS